jgi:ribosome maturation factor RimP
MGSAEIAGWLPAFFLKPLSESLREKMAKEIVDRVRAIAEPILSNEGMELVEIEYRRESKGWILRLYIDKGGGVTLDDCTHISQEVGRSLDVEDFISMPYRLEISSPGLTRSLKKKEDFMKYRNHRIKVKTYDPIENRWQFKGRLLDVFENHIEIEMEEGIFKIPLSNVSKANLEIDWNTVWRKGPIH